MRTEGVGALLQAPCNVRELGCVLSVVLLCTVVFAWQALVLPFSLWLGGREGGGWVVASMPSCIGIRGWLLRAVCSFLFCDGLMPS